MKADQKKLYVKQAFSRAVNETEAAAEFIEKVSQPNASLVVFFVSSVFDLNKLEIELKGCFTAPVIGCTTAGEITPEGYSQKTITGFSLASDELKVFPFLIPDLQNFDGEKTGSLIQAIKSTLEQERSNRPEASAFGLLLIDGLSIMEEQVSAILANAVEPVPIVGGSAGDDFKLENTHVFLNDSFVTDAALITFFVTTQPFHPIKTQHFSAGFYSVPQAI